MAPCALRLGLGFSVLVTSIFGGAFWQAQDVDEGQYAVCGMSAQTGSAVKD